MWLKVRDHYTPTVVMMVRSNETRIFETLIADTRKKRAKGAG